MTRLQPLCGLVLIGLVAYAFSTDRRAIRLRTVAWGFALQLLFAVIVLRTGLGQATLQAVADKISRLLSFSMVGSAFVFGPIGDQSVWQRMMTTVFGPEGAQYGTIFAFQIAPAISSDAFWVCVHLGVMQPWCGCS
jgi:CNT family concentrative nucleoside transporter